MNFTELQLAATTAKPKTTVNLYGQEIELPAFMRGDFGADLRFEITVPGFRLVNGTLFQPRMHSGIASVNVRAAGVVLNRLDIIGPDRLGDAWDMAPEARRVLPQPFAVQVWSPGCKIINCDIRCWTHGVMVQTGADAEISKCRFSSIMRAGLGYCAVTQGGFFWLHHCEIDEYRHICDTAGGMINVGYVAEYNKAEGPVARGAALSSHAFGAHDNGDGFGADVIVVNHNDINVPDQRLAYICPPRRAGLFFNNQSGNVPDLLTGQVGLLTGQAGPIYVVGGDRSRLDARNNIVMGALCDEAKKQ